MPIIRIPGRDAGGGPPPFSVSFDAAAAPGRALAGIGGAITDVGESLLREGRKADELTRFRERAQINVALKSELSGLGQELTEFSRSNLFTESNFKQFRAAALNDIYKPMISATSDPQLKATLEGELQGQLEADLTEQFQAIQIDRAAVQLGEHEELLAEAFTLQPMGENLLRLGEFGQEAEALKEKFPELGLTVERALDRTAKSFKAAMLSRPGGESSYYRALNDRLHLQGEGAYPQVPTFVNDMANSLSSLRRIAVDTNRLATQGVSSPTLINGRYEAFELPDTPNLLGVSPDIDALVGSAESANKLAANRLNAYVDYVEGNAPPPPYATDVESQNAFTRFYQDSVLGTISNPGVPFNERFDLALGFIRDFEQVPAPHANALRGVIEAARGQADPQAINGPLLEVAAQVFAVTTGNPMLTSAGGSSFSERARRAIGLDAPKTKDVLNPDQVAFLRDYLLQSGRTVDPVAAISNAREAQEGRARVGAAAETDTALLEFLQVNTEKFPTLEAFAEDRLNEYAKVNPIWSGIDLDEDSVLAFRSILETEMGRTTDMGVAQTKAFARFTREYPAVPWMGKAITSRDVSELSDGKGTRWLEVQTISSLARMPELLKQAAAEAESEEDRAVLLEHKARWDALASRLDDKGFVSRIRIDRLVTSPDTVTVSVVSKFDEDGLIVLEPGFEILGVIDDPRGGGPLQLEMDYEKSELGKIEKMENLAISNAQLENVQLNFATQLEREPDGGDLINEWEELAGALESSWLMTGEEFGRKWLSTTGIQSSGQAGERHRLRAEMGDALFRFLETDPDEPMFMRVPRYRNQFIAARTKIFADEQKRLERGRRGDTPSSALAGFTSISPEEVDRQAAAAVLLMVKDEMKGKTLSERLFLLLNAEEE